MSSRFNAEKPVWIGVLVQTPLGEIWVAGSPDGLVAVNLWGERDKFEVKFPRKSGHER